MKILVFGAGGCVGGWVSEELASRGDIDLVAVVRRWASAPRLARRGIAISQADLTDANLLAHFVAKADAVINAAQLPPQHEADLVTSLYSLCVKAGVRRFVQFSSAVVYGNQAGNLDERSSLAPKGDYAVGKAEMERRLLATASGRPTQAVILRPSIVYGPFADVWTSLYAQRIVKGRWRTLGKAGEGLCNPVHADDLARMAIVAATSDLPGGPHLLNINGPDVVSWNEYIERFGNALGAAGRTTPNYPSFMAAAWAAHLTRAAGGWAKAKGFYRQGGRAQPIADEAKSFAKLYPYPEEIRLLRCKARYLSDRSIRTLGIRPSISLADGLHQAADWCRIHGVVARC